MPNCGQIDGLQHPNRTRKGPYLHAYLKSIGLLVLILGAIGLYLANRFATMGEEFASPPPVTVAAAVTTVEAWDDTLEAVGTVRAVRGVELSAEASGEIAAIDVTSGQAVSEGQQLIVLNDRIEQASKARQQANLELARLLFERDESLIAQKSIPQSQYDRSRADLRSAIAQLAEIEARIDNKRIRAPFSGTLGIIQVRVGNYIESGTSITTLQDLSELEVDFSVPARYAPLLKPGLSASLSTSAFPDRRFAAKLQAIDSSVDPSTRNLLLRASIGESGGLLPGMFARIRIDLDAPQLRVTAPETAVSYSLQGNMVYRILEDGDGLYVEPQIVTTGTVRDGKVVIRDGVQAGERLVSAGQNKLYRGARVQIDSSVQMK